MKLIFEKKELLGSLSIGASLCAKNKTMPVLDNVRITTKGERCKLTFSDGESCLMKYFNLIESDEDVDFLVNCGDLQRCLQSLKDELVKIEAGESGVVSVVYNNGSMDFVSLPADEFPTINQKNETSKYKIECKEFVNDCIRNARNFAENGVNNFRPILCGMHMILSNNSITCCSTNGSKLFFDKESNIVQDWEEKGVTIPNKCFSLLTSVLSNSLSDVYMTVTDKNFSIESSGCKFFSVLVEGRFPNFNAVIRNSSRFNIEVPKNELIESIKRVMLCSNSSKAVMLTFKDKECLVKAEDMDFQKSAKETIPTNTFIDDDSGVCFITHGESLIHSLESHDADVISLEYEASEKSIQVKGQSNRITITMPMRSL